MARTLPQTRETITIDDTTYYVTDDELINVENQYDRIDLYDAWGPIDPVEAESRAWSEMQEVLPV